jgi:hypothetical protein
MVFMFGAALVLLANGVRAQFTDVSPAPVSLEAATDTQLLLAALESVPPIPFAQFPQHQRGGTFWSAQHPQGSLGAWPPLPANFYGLSVWPLGDGQFVLDDRQVDYVAIQAAYDQAAKLDAAATLKTTRLTASPLTLAMNLASSVAYGNPVYLTNLVVTAGPMTASFEIAGGTNFVPFDILTTTNLATPMANWNWLGLGYTSNPTPSPASPPPWRFTAWRNRPRP